ncbi:hypothetical protein GW17_00006883 [Ensete ventricosum]|nr:hypothetical protein GW17_00006883 [Ensete ventricosum]RZR75952.1 hypothetical protein BHM03_00000537 [Ensete ventricosum]
MDSRSSAPLALQRLPGPLCINTTIAQIGPSPAIAAPIGTIDITIIVALLRIDRSCSKKDTAIAPPYNSSCAVAIHCYYHPSSNPLLPLQGSKHSYLFLPYLAVLSFALLWSPEPSSDSL